MYVSNALPSMIHHLMTTLGLLWLLHKKPEIEERKKGGSSKERAFLEVCCGGLHDFLERAEGHDTSVSLREEKNKGVNLRVFSQSIPICRHFHRRSVTSCIDMERGMTVFRRSKAPSSGFGYLVLFPS